MESTKMLGQQPVKKLLLKFSVPCVMGLLIGALYNIVDQIFIGNSSLGYLGNAATGVSFPVICIANAFAWCIGDGAAAYLSICAGRQDSESSHKCVGTGLSSTFVISVVLALVSIIFCEPMMRIFGASDATLPLAVSYFRIIATFFPPYLMFNVMNSMIRADGSPSYAMVALLTGAVLNIVLDPVCIFLLDWGIQGAAIATVTGQIVSFVLCAVYFRKPKSFHLHKSSFKIDFHMLRNLITMGGSTFIIQISIVIMTMLSNVMMFKYGALSPFGSDIPISVYSIQTKVFTIVISFAVGIALGAQPVLGYNYGAKKMDRVKEAYKLMAFYGLLIGFACTLLFVFAPQIVIRFFGSQNDLYMNFAVTSFRISLSLLFVTCFIKMSSIFFQSIGKAGYAMIASLVRDSLCFVTFTILLCNLFESAEPGKGIYGILFAAPLSDAIAGIVILVLTIKFFNNLPVTEKNNDNPVYIADSAPGAIITIARQHGTQGKHIGKLVADKLGIPFYSKELTALVAKESGLAEEFVDSDYDDISEVYHQLYLSTNVGQHSVIAQEQVLNKIAAKGSCVIVGRAADYVLGNNPDTVKIFLYAPEEYRIKNIEMMYNDSPEDARRHMIKSDTSRAAYYRNISGKDWGNSSNYNLCIDVSMGKEKAADLIVKYINSNRK